MTTPENLAQVIADHPDLFVTRFGLYCDCSSPKPGIAFTYIAPDGREVLWLRGGRSADHQFRLAARAYVVGEPIPAVGLFTTCPRCSGGYFVCPRPGEPTPYVTRFAAPEIGTVT